MVQLKRMRRLIRDGIIKIEHQEQKVSDQSIRNFYVRIKMLFKLKLKMSHGDRQMTKKLYKRLNDFSIDVGIRLDKAKRRKEDILKKQKTRTTKLIIRELIRNLKEFAKSLEDGLSATYTDEDEEERVRTIAQLASARLQCNSAQKGLIEAIEQEIQLLEDTCDLEEEFIRNFTVFDV